MNKIKSSKNINELIERKIRIVHFFTNVILALSLLFIAGEFGVYTLLNMQVRTHATDAIFSTIFLVFASFLRFILLKKNFKITFWIIIVMLLFVSFSAFYDTGTTYPHSYLLFVLIIISSATVLDRKKTFIIFIIIVVVTLSITLLHNLHVLNQSPIQIRTYYWSGVYLIITLFLAKTVVKLAYENINQTYKKASDLAKKYESLNTKLDKKIILQTKQIKQYLEDKVQSMYNTAIVGKITTPLLEDLEQPVNQIKSTISQIDPTVFDTRSKKFFKIAQEAVLQMERIIRNGKDLINQKLQATSFSPNKIVQIILFILKNDLMKHGIQVKVNIPTSLKIYGIVTIFERIVMNILQNAIEELAICKKRVIQISGRTTKSHFILSIKDTGRGIEQENMKRLFDPDFSPKEGHLGIGLPFVKSIIDKKFGGKMQVKSKIGKFTEFILYFKKIK